MQVESLRAVLHEAIDRVIDSYVADSSPAPSDMEDAGADEQIEVVTGEEHGPFRYRWPSGDEEPFSRSRWYTLRDHDRESRALVAWTEREAWGRMRTRAVIFGARGSSLYPWAEFVETDDGQVAAGIPDLARPRALLKDGDDVPDRFTTATVARSDRLFGGIRHGPSLRLVLGPEDELGMVRHGAWVGSLRGRL